MRFISQQRRRARESLRVSVLQPQAQGRKGRAGHGDTAGTVLGAVDGCGLSACLGSSDRSFLGGIDGGVLEKGEAETERRWQEGGMKG